MDAKIFRVNYKSDFILTLTSDAGWMTPFCIKFWTGSPMLAYYASYDGETYTHCTYDPSEPTKLTVQFDDHHLPIGNLKYQVAYHFTVADFPENTEDEVTNQANVTTEIDGETYQVMLDINGETAPEIQFALPAYANELQRIQNEQTRIAQEQQRVTQEQTRINQEAARVTEFNGIKAEALADHQRANEDHARALSDSSNAASDSSRASSDHSRAESDHYTATSDHSQASSDHGRAQSDNNTAMSDHQTALSDHTQANTDHSRAESDHSRAMADSSTAAADHNTAATDHTQANTDHARAESDHQRVETDLAEVEEFSNSLGPYDISAAHATGSTLATYPDLATALGTNGSNIPEALRKGGMSVKYVQTYDNKYVQYRYMLEYENTTAGNAAFLNVANWQGVDDVSAPGSKNLISSAGAFNRAVIDRLYINTSYHASFANNTASIVKGVRPGEKYYLYIEVSAIVNSAVRRISLFEDYTVDPETVLSHYWQNPNTFIEITVPQNARQLVICCRWTDGTGNPDGYHLLTADEYFAYLKEYNRAVSVEGKNLSVASVQSFTDAEKARGLSNLGVSIVDNISPGSKALVKSDGIFVQDFVSGYITPSYTFKITNDLSTQCAILRKVKYGETYHVIVDSGAITRGDERRVAFFGEWTPVDGSILNPIATQRINSENTWYELTVPSSANYMVIQTRFTPDGMEGVGNPNGYHLYTNDEYLLIGYSLPDYVNVLKNKTIYWFGDSIIEGYGQYPYTTKYGWATPIEEKYGAICDNQGVSGSTYRDKTSLGIHCIGNDLISYISALSSSIKIDYIIILGGFNDRDNSSAWGTVNANNFVDYPNNDMSYTTLALENLCSYLQNSERLSDTKFGVIIPYTVNDAPDNPGWEPSHWNELADRLIQVLNKWGIPYLDLRKTCGFTLCSENSRKIYSTDLTTFEGDYDPTAGYSADQRVKYQGIVYRAKQAITAPAGVWDASKWTQISDNNGYDRTHINRFAYDKTSSLVADWIMSL